MKPEKNPLLNLAIAIMTPYYQEIGSQHFDSFAPVAQHSAVPTRFHYAVGQLINSLADEGMGGEQLDQEMAFRLFGKQMHTQKAGYARSYGVAVSTSKAYFSAVQQAELSAAQTIQGRELITPMIQRHNQRYLTSVASFDESGKMNLGLGFTFLHDLRELQDLYNQMIDTDEAMAALSEQTRNLAQVNVGMLMESEARLRGEHLETASDKAKSVIKRGLQSLNGSQFGITEAMQTRDEVEEYFQNPQSAARICLLAEPPRI